MGERRPPGSGMAALHRLLLQRGLTICAAESCTGGLICAALTDLPGASAFFLGGVVAYANDVKVARLGVSRTSLAAHGAVSAEVAREMARGVKTVFGADVALSVTGVAGPGADGEKPAGLTYIACAVQEQVEVREYTWPGDRSSNRAASVEAAVELALDSLLAQHDNTV